MKKISEEDEIKGLQVQWFFVLLGALLAVVAGITVNSLYDILKAYWPAWVICVVFGSITLLFLDAFTYLFDHVKDIRRNPDMTFKQFLLGYCKHSVRSVKGWFAHRKKTR